MVRDVPRVDVVVQRPRVRAVASRVAGSTSVVSHTASRRSPARSRPRGAPLTRTSIRRTGELEDAWLPRPGLAPLVRAPAEAASKTAGTQVVWSRPSNDPRRPLEGVLPLE